MFFHREKDKRPHRRVYRRIRCLEQDHNPRSHDPKRLGLRHDGASFEEQRNG